jgi:hypothetical protein
MLCLNSSSGSRRSSSSTPPGTVGNKSDVDAFIYNLQQQKEKRMHSKRPYIMAGSSSLEQTQPQLVWANLGHVIAHYML